MALKLYIIVDFQRAFDTVECMSEQRLKHQQIYDIYKD